MSVAKPLAVALASLLAGAAVVHRLYQPDLVRFVICWCVGAPTSAGAKTKRKVCGPLSPLTQTIPISKEDSDTTD